MLGEKYKRIKEVKVIRFETSDQGTKSIVVVDGLLFCRCMELPWYDNQRSISCIPVGEYDTQAIIRTSGAQAYLVKDVPGRSRILIHPGNYAGDTAKGFKTHSHGCLLFGKCFAIYKGQKMVSLSRTTVRRFMNFMEYKPFKLTIEEKIRNG